MSKLSNEVVLTIAQAILANTKVLQSLVDSLPKETREEVAAEVTKTTPVAETPQVPAPQVVPVPAAPEPPVLQQVSIPVPSVMPAAPFPTAGTAPAVAPVAPPAGPPASGTVPQRTWNDQTGLIKWAIEQYKRLGARGNEIQTVMTSIGITNINQVDPSLYDQLYNGVMAL